MSKMKEMNAPVKEAGGSMVFTAIAVLILLGGLAVIYFAFFAPLPGLDVSSLERGGHTKGSADAKVSILHRRPPHIATAPLRNPYSPEEV